MVKIKQKVDNDIYLVSIGKGYITVGDVINTERADRDTSLWFNFHKLLPTKGLSMTIYSTCLMKRIFYQIFTLYIFNIIDKKGQTKKATFLKILQMIFVLTPKVTQEITMVTFWSSLNQK